MIDFEIPPAKGRTMTKDVEKTFDLLMGAKLEAALTTLIPIRDLARNWDIDIASCLEEYLKELVEISDHVDTDIFVSNSTNFTQAALLLQNSSSVYSRKVEYLHSLVYSTLSELQVSTAADTRRKAKQRILTENQQIMDRFETFDPELDFLLLDDVLPTFRGDQLHKINLDKNKDIYRLVNYSETLPSNINDSDTALVQNDYTRLSLGGLSITGLERSAYTAPSEENIVHMNKSSGNKILLRSLITEMIDGEYENNNGGSSGTLRLLGGKCVISDTGAFLIPGTLMYDSQTHLEVQQDDFQSTDHDLEDKNDKAPIRDDVKKEELDFECNNEIEDCFNSEAHNYGECDGSINDGISFQLNSDYRSKIEKTESTPCHIELKSIDTPIGPDPWLLLDPLSEEITFSSKTLKVKKTYRLPPGIVEPPSECVTGARTKSSHLRRVFPNKRDSSTNTDISDTAGKVYAVSTFTSIIDKCKVDKGVHSNASENEKHDQAMSFVDENITLRKETIPLQGLVFGNEFAYIAKINAKQKSQNSTLVKDGNVTFSKSIGNVKNSKTIPETEQENHVADNLDFHDNLYFGYEYNDELPDQDDEKSDDGNVQSIFGFGEDGNLDGFVDHDEFEELCRAHIKSFACGSERYAINSNLSQRIDKWQTKIIPILEEEQTRTEFDVHYYGERILEAMKEDIIVKRHKKRRKDDLKKEMRQKEEPNKTVDFRSITANSEPHEVCRLFLTSLMLSNSGNISLSNDGEGIQEDFESKEQLHMELLSDKLELPIELYGAQVQLGM